MTIPVSNLISTFLWCVLASFLVNDVNRFVDHVINSAACQDSEQMVRPVPKVRR